MTLTKSLLLGSAAGLVAVASAQAADLPTRKGPVAVEYVRVCSITVAGAPVVGFVLPGSDTCFKISGYITGQVEGGNVKTAYYQTNTNARLASEVTAGNGPLTSTLRQGGRDIQFIVPNGGADRDTFGYTTRFNVTFDAVSNTAYGPLVAHGEYQFNHGGGFDNAGTGGSDGGLNRAYVTWAGITAGKIDSFFSFTGGGLAWNNFFSPDRKGFDQPDVLAYTASFGGGFSATISIEDPYNSGSNGNNISVLQGGGTGTYMGYLGSATEQGLRVPDVVGSLDVKQAWGTAHLAGVLHNIRADGTFGANATQASIDKYGYAIDAGVSFNIPNLPAGSMVGVTGSWSQNADRYGGLPDAMNGEEGAVNGNGQNMAIADAFLNSNGSWATPTSWSVSGYAAFQVTPQVNLGIEGSYGENTWSGKQAISALYDSKAWLIGGIAHYDPVKNLDFEFELLYENVRNSQPTAYVAGNPALGQTTTWQGNADGFQARFEVTRNF
jgi:Porin subfamily